MSDASEHQPTGALAWSPLQVGIALGVLLFLAFPSVLLGRESFFFRDYGVLAYPTIQFAKESWLRGEVPLWNPLSNCGVPFLAQWGTMALYPGSLIYILLPLPWSLGLFCLLHVWLGGMGMNRLAFAWTGSRFGAAVAAAAYVFNGMMLSSLVWPNYLVALGLMPWVVLLVERAWSSGGRMIVWATLVAALQVLAGVPEILVLTWLVVGALWIATAMKQWRGQARETFIGGGRIALVGILVAGLTAVQMLPFLELLHHSQRQAGAMVVKWAMPLWGFANLIVPLFHCFMTPQGNFFQQSQEFLPSYYPGIAALAFGLIALFQGGARRKWLLGGLIVFALLMAVGPQGFLYDWVKAVVPGLGLARYPVKFLFLMTFALPLLAAYALPERGLEAASTDGNPEAHERSWSWTVRELKRPEGRAPWIGTLIFLLLATVILLWTVGHWRFQYDQVAETQKNGMWRMFFLVTTLGAAAGIQWVGRAPVRTGLQCAVIVLIWFDAITHSPNQNPTLPSSAFAALAPPTLKPPPGSRLFITPAAERALLHSSVTNFLDDFTGKRLAYWSNLNLIDGVAKVNGSATLQIRAQAEVQNAFYTPPEHPMPGLLDFLAVSVITEPGKVLDYTNRPTALPLVTAGQKPVFINVGSNPNAVLQALTNASFASREIVYVKGDPGSGMPTNQVHAQVINQGRTTQRIWADVEADAPTVAVLAESAYSWSPYVNGQPGSVVTANHAFQATPIPAGRSHVEWVYQDRDFKLGLWITGVTVLLCGVGLLGSKFRPSLPRI